MKSTINAIKVLVKARNKKYSELSRLTIDEKISWNDSPLLVIKGFEASAYFAQMKPFLEPMICQVNIKEEREVELQFNNN